MTEGKTLERNECKTDNKQVSTLGGDMMACKSFNDLFRQQVSGGNDLSFLPDGKQLLDQLNAAPHGPRCEAPTTEKRGPVEVTIDENGEMIGVKDTHGNTFTKRADGKWNKHFESGTYKTDDVADNVKVDCKGNVSWDYNSDERNVHVHHEYNADGSISYTNEFGKFEYDKTGALIGAPAGDGFDRRFHYTNGQLDAIDGRLGHWDRVNKDGQISWVNKNTGAVWQGDFEVTVDSLLKFKGTNGAAWTFTPWGTDIDDNKQKVMER